MVSLKKFALGYTSDNHDARGKTYPTPKKENAQPTVGEVPIL